MHRLWTSILLLGLFALVWAMPALRLLVTPTQRAQTFVASTICQGRPAHLSAANISGFARTAPLVTTHTPARVAELAEPFVAAFERPWRKELAALALAAFALPAALLRWRAWPVLLLASVAGAVAVHGLKLDAFMILKAAGPTLWWSAIRQWSAPMLLELVLTPLALGALASWAAWQLVKRVAMEAAHLRPSRA